MTTTHDLHGTTVEKTFLFGSNGSISMPLPSLGSSTFKIKSGGIVWPSHQGLAHLPFMALPGPRRAPAGDGD